MRIIISPAKRMKIDPDTLSYEELPNFLSETRVLLEQLQQLSYDEAKKLWNCNNEIASYHYGRLTDFNLYQNLTPAILAYQGIQYQYMAPSVFQMDEMHYIREHLRILSGFYGLLKPFDGVVPYRLEMQAKLKTKDGKSLYDYWNNKLASQLFSESKEILNIASAEYSKCISRYIDGDKRFVTCIFGERINDKVVEKGTYAKMARGEMVRFMAERRIKKMEEIKQFDRLNYMYAKDLSDEKTFVFIRRK